MTLVRRLALLALPAALFGCPKQEAPAPADAGKTVAAVTADAGGGGAKDDVDSVYPVDPKAPIDPLAERLCSALGEMPEKKRAACCSTTPGIVVTAECSRTLSAALRYKAVEISAATVDACVAAFEKTLEGCDWVGPFPPGPPKECQGIVKGLLAEGARCRSSLECSGSLRCRGVGPTTAGKCAPPRAVGELCGGSTDTLATFVRQNDLDKQHPECATGHCIKHRCAEAVAANEPCTVTADCAEGLQCLPTGGAKKGGPPAQKCTAAPLPAKEGEACPGGVCAGDLQCTLGKCTRPKPAGEECTTDFECRGGCVKSGGAAKGKCGPRCDIR